jgi:dipeptidyl-peptidase-4
MKTIVCALAILLLSTAPLLAVDPIPASNGKPVDTSFLKKYAETRRFMLGRPQNPKIAPDNKSVLFLRADADKPTLKLFEFDVASGQSKELLSPATLLKGGEENLSAEEKARRERMRLSAGGFADFHYDSDGKRVLLPLSGKLFVFERASSKVTELKTGAGGSIVDPKWSPDGKKIAYVRGFDLHVCDLASKRESAVTHGGTALKTHGLAEFVAQEEMGRFTGYWWSPDSTRIAYEEADHTGVETWYVADPFKPGQKPVEQYYPRPGKKNVSVRLGVVPVEGGETVWMKWPEPDQNRFPGQHFEYLTKVVWDKYGPLMVQLQTRSQELVSSYKVNHTTGETEWLFDIVAPGHWVNLKKLELRWTVDGRLGATIGNARETVAQKHDFFRIDGRVDHFESLVHFDPETYETLFAGTGLSTDMHLFRSEGKPSEGKLPTRPARALTRGRGAFSAVGNGKVICLTETTATAMPRTRVVSAEGTLFGELPSVAAEPEFKPNIQFLLGKPSAIRGDEAFDGARQGAQPSDEFAMAVVRPRHFDPKKKYPVIVDVYGGPGHVHVACAMRNWLVPQWLADQGFIVVAIDNRGTPAHGSLGEVWEKAIARKFGTVPLEDQVKGLHELCAMFPELDETRVGIVGWSFGGYMAANGVLRQPEVFKAAVAGAPVTDWEDYDSHYTERYMGLLPAEKAAYDGASLLPLAKNLKRPLLLVHGTADDNVYYRHSLKLVDALFRAGTEFEALPLPGVTHMYTSDPVVMERLWARTAGFFKTHLAAPK